LWEFPLTHDEDGWTEGLPGGARIIMSKEKTKPYDVFHGVVGHDKTRDVFHYAAIHVQAKKKAKKRA